VDSLTTNPGHALWSGIADDDLADQYLDRLMEPAMWTGWGLRTLADTMEAYDPLSYHNGSVWPHDTALCAAGAGRHQRWEVVERSPEAPLMPPSSSKVATGALRRHRTSRSAHARGVPVLVFPSGLGLRIRAPSRPSASRSPPGR
jgi:hypothetical protein